MPFPICSDNRIIWFFTEAWGRSSLGARLRTRKVTGRDASLPAPLLSAFAMMVARGTVGATPQLSLVRPIPKEVANKGAGSEASLPVTLRVRSRAPKLLFPQESVKNHKIAKFRGCSQMHPRISYIPTICPITSSPALPSRSSTTAAFQPNALCSITRKSAAMASTSAVSSVCS